MKRMIACWMFFASQIYAAQNAENYEDFLSVKKAILKMYASDQRVRYNIANSFSMNPGLPKKIFTDWQKIGRQNTARLKLILQDWGWPTKEIWGDDVTDAVWILI